MITQAIANSFKVELFRGVHDFSADTFKLALYTSAASLDKTTTAYSATNEVGASGSYSPGGGTMTSATPVLDGDVAVCDFADVTFTAMTTTARGALPYNSLKGNKAVFVMDFGGDKTTENGSFGIVFPTPNAASAILRIG